MIKELKAAKKLLLKCGWVGPQLEPWCRDRRGRPVHHTDEAVQTFSCTGALQLAGAPLEPALELLGRVVSPALAQLRELESRYTLDELLDLLLEDERRRPCFLELDAEWWALQHRAVGEFLSFGGWLVQRDRTRDDVLRVFSTAVLRSSREGVS